MASFDFHAEYKSQNWLYWYGRLEPREATAAS
jgi:hypothetical protein